MVVILTFVAERKLSLHLINHYHDLMAYSLLVFLCSICVRVLQTTLAGHMVAGVESSLPKAAYVQPLRCAAYIRIYVHANVLFCVRSDPTSSTT